MGFHAHSQLGTDNQVGRVLHLELNYQVGNSNLNEIFYKDRNPIIGAARSSISNIFRINLGNRAHGHQQGLQFFIYLVTLNFSYYQLEITRQK